MKFFLLVLLFLSACTTMKEKNVHRKDLIIWDLERTYKTKHTYSAINLLYKTCFPAKDRKYDFWESLRVEFQKKFGVELIGLADAESRSFYVQENVCLNIKGHPVTEKKLKNEVTGDIEIIDQR